jgi:hypothetical protein
MPERWEIGTLRMWMSASGARSDLDWDEAVEELDRLRHASRPTPPLLTFGALPARYQPARRTLARRHRRGRPSTCRNGRPGI